MHQHNHNCSHDGHKHEDIEATEMDVASKSLSEALRKSFIILKIIIIVLAFIFIASGFRTISSDEQALVLRFGKIRGSGDDRVLKPGWDIGLPYPIEEIVRIPITKQVNLPINSFWYFQTPEEALAKSQNAPATLNPLQDGYCLTLGGGELAAMESETGSDYGIIHTKWQIIYSIDDPDKFYRNIYIQDVKSGDSYADILKKTLNPLLQNITESAVVTTVPRYTIDQIISTSVERMANEIKTKIQEQLNSIQSGVTVTAVLLADKTWPRQVDPFFVAAVKASQSSQKAIDEAKAYAENTLNEAAGPAGDQLLTALKDPNASDEQLEKLWSQLAGKGQEEISQARAYRTKIVEGARANADYLKQLLPEYRKYPELVVQKIYQDAIEQVFNNADEKMIIQPTSESKSSEIRVLLNRDPSLKPKKEQEQKQENK